MHFYSNAILNVPGLCLDCAWTVPKGLKITIGIVLDVARNTIRCTIFNPGPNPFFVVTFYFTTLLRVKNSTASESTQKNPPKTVDSASNTEPLPSLKKTSELTCTGTQSESIPKPKSVDNGMNTERNVSDRDQGSTDQNRSVQDKADKPKNDEVNYVNEQPSSIKTSKGIEYSFKISSTVMLATKILR